MTEIVVTFELLAMVLCLANSSPLSVVIVCTLLLKGASSRTISLATICDLLLTGSESLRYIDFRSTIVTIAPCFPLPEERGLTPNLGTPNLGT